MDWLTDWLIGFASERNHPIGFAVLAGSAMLEYVFPPFPGDTITLFGAVLITGYGWSGIGIFAAVLAGSLAGSMFDYWIGLRLRRRPRAEQGPERRRAMDRLVARFERHGPAYLMINRFLPGIRAFFFVAAGMAGMRWRPVLLYGAASVMLWNGLLVFLGAAVGANLDSLEYFVKRYTTVAWIVLGGLLVAYLTWRIVKRRRASGSSEL
jgi:membrane protein DedA with SNARE-associated domain